MKETTGSANVGVVCAGSLVHPVDVIVTDIGGVVIVPRQGVAGVVYLCEEHLPKEAKNRERLRAGELELDIYMDFGPS